MNSHGLCKSFQEFYENWMVERNQQLKKLVLAIKNSPPEHNLILLINSVIQQYQDYFKAKSQFAKREILSFFSQKWTSSLEQTFLWIGGFRPTTSFHLLYSKLGLQLESRLSASTCRTSSATDLADLTSSQLARVNELQKRTTREEREVTEKMAKYQETLAHSAMVELAHLATRSMMMTEHDESRGAGYEERVELVLAEKEADDLRLRTLKGVIEILSPTQAVHFLIAATELQLRVHEWGLERDKRVHFGGYFRSN
ncbi:Transcription factor TGA like domain [Dillenia turbinata]|uniref:Transcription factor TGA like domain n=1 Tax=Dillenia turbinata TaxID=194707 RepID=A0AAN8W4P1_9MAGN